MKTNKMATMLLLAAIFAVSENVSVNELESAKVTAFVNMMA